MIRKESELSFRQKENSDCQLAIGQKKKKIFFKVHELHRKIGPLQV